jgi:predicted hydrocarbon binding protein
MHGLIFIELKKYVESKFDSATWELLLEKAGQKHRFRWPPRVYPDSDILSLVTCACEMTGLSANAILEDFGEFIAPNLVERYKFLISPDWRLLDFLANTDDTIHTVLRVQKGTTPPWLVANRVADDTMVITYTSARKMCALLRGIVKGAAKCYKEEVSISEGRCMLLGDSECSVTIQVAPAKNDPEPALDKAAARET